MTRYVWLIGRLSAALFLFGALAAVAPAPAQEKKEPAPSPFAGRSGEAKAKLLKLGGGNDKSEEAVAAGLKWLALHQCQNGSWSLNDFHKHTRTEPFPAGKIFEDPKMTGMGQPNDTAATALALLPFLAAGHTHKANKELNPNYQKTIAAGLTWLITQQGRDGSFPGGIYAHCLATLAVCEAYAMTKDPALKTPAQAAIVYLVAFQNKEGGGWRYQKGTPGDLSVTAWVMQVFHAAKAGGLVVPDASLKGAEQFIDSCEDAGNKGCYCYTPAAGRTPSMTAAGNLSRRFLGATPRNAKLLTGVAFLKTMPPGSTKNLYQEYYAARLMHSLDQETWKAWFEGEEGKEGLRDYLIKSIDTGDKVQTQAGSWFLPGGQTAAGGRIFCTSLALLCLQTPYRHVPEWADLKKEP
jgi:hypothetical protein